MTSKVENAEEILEIVRMGHPVLREVAEPVPQSALGTPALREFGDALISTMMAAQGVGLAAPQVARGWRCFAYYVPSDEEDDGATVLRPKVLINPEIRPVGQVMETGWEGCLSIPAIRGQVPRHFSLEVTALDVEGRPLCFQADDFHARVIQHEYDHLDGVLFLDRMESMESLAFEKEWIRYTLGYDVADDPEDE